MVAVLAVLWLAGILVATPVVWWWARDMARIPRPVWYWTGRHRQTWTRGIGVGLLLSGWPAIVIVVVWARSAERVELLDEAHDFYSRLRLHHDSTPTRRTR